MSNKKNFFAPSTTGLGATRRAAMLLLVMMLTATTAWATDKTLSGSESYTAQNGDVLTGSTSGTVTIANNATITLSDVTITGGIVCEGTAEITLVGTNSVTGFSRFDPNINAVRYTAGIQIGGSGTTLTINGNGSLTANGGENSAGIGLNGAWNVTEDVIGGNIVIESGIIAANGGEGAAGIGAGFTKDMNNSSERKAIVGNITIKGGTVTAVGVTAEGGNGADGIGAGDNIYDATYQIGTVTIYDDIDKVDASSISESVTYMHVDGNTETDVTANASTYFTITEDGNRRVIVPKDNTDYTITIADGIEHGTLTGAATAKYMEMVTINATPDFGYRLSRLEVRDAQNNDVASTDNSFFMPKSNVTVSAEFEQGTHGTTEFAWGYFSPSSGYVTEATIYDGVTTVELQQGKKYFIGKDYQEGPQPGMGFYENTFRPDEDPYADGRDIPYSGGTGSFMEGGYGNFRLNGDAGFYDITMTDVGNGKWNVSILKTAGQMDVVPDQTYIGSAITPEPLVIAGSLNLTKGTDYVYSYTNNTNVGTAKVRATFQGDYASLGYVEKEFNIVKATPAVNAPTAVADLVYKGSAQALVNAGSTDFGTLLYSLDGQNYSADIPTGTDAGTYTVYYKVEGSDNWNAVAAQTIEVTITYFDASLAAIVDNSDVISNIITNYGSKADVTLSGRTLYKDGYWNTLVLPFDVTIASSPLAGDNVVAKVLNESSKLDNGTLTLNFENALATIPAGTPFIIKWSKSDDLVNPVFTGVTIDNTNRDVNFTGGSFMGTYAPLEITDANRSKVLLLSGKNKLGYAKTDRTIANGKALGTCRAYFYFPGSQTARSFVMNFEEEGTPTGVGHTEITESTEMADAIYDLQGRHVEKAKKGLYIVNGKKKFVR